MMGQIVSSLISLITSVKVGLCLPVFREQALAAGHQDRTRSEYPGERPDEQAANQMTNHSFTTGAIIIHWSGGEGRSG